MDNTIIKVGHVEKDQYNNLLVTPHEGGKQIKIGAKREHLHHLFEQGKSVMLHWETYMDKPYVQDAQIVEGEPKEPAPGAPESPKKAVKEELATGHQEGQKGGSYKADPAKIASIERQTSLKCATEIAIARIAQGKDFKMAELLTAAKIFESYLESGIIIEERKPIETKPKVT